MCHLGFISRNMMQNKISNKKQSIDHCCPNHASPVRRQIDRSQDLPVLDFGKSERRLWQSLQETYRQWVAVDGHSGKEFVFVLTFHLQLYNDKFRTGIRWCAWWDIFRLFAVDFVLLNRFALLRIVGLIKGDKLAYETNHLALNFSWCWLLRFRKTGG